MHLLTCILTLAFVPFLVTGQLQTILEWEHIDYLWPSNLARTRAIQSGQYIPSRVIPMDVDRDRAGRVFLTFYGIPGVPATLGIVSTHTGPEGPLIRPYPNWSWFRKGSCDSLQDIYRIWIDECNRLWVLDTGFVEGEVIRCEAQLVVFDLNTDRWINTVKIPNHIARDKNGTTLLAIPIVDTEGHRCEKTTVYIGDTFGKALIMMNATDTVRFENSVFHPSSDPKAHDFQTGNDHIVFPDAGLLGMAISPRTFPNERKFLLFSSLCAFDLFAVSIDDLESKSSIEEMRIQRAENLFPSQIISMAFSRQGTLFFGLTRENAVGCWNKYRPLTRANLNIVAQDDEKLQYLNSVKVIKPSISHPVEELWVLSNRYIAFLNGKLENQTTKYRVLRGPVHNLVKNTACDIQ